jgi:low affinity Fe/Cu permease
MAKAKNKLGKFFDKFSTKATRVTGSVWAFIIALAVILIWAVTGPIFNFSDTWQLVINTGTTIITFLMVFLIQQTQNKDTTAVHLKLNELIASSTRASNRLVDSEDLTEEELQTLKKFYVRLSDLAEKEDDLTATHTIEEAHQQHGEKSKSRPKSGKKKVTPTTRKTGR